MGNMLERINRCRRRMKNLTDVFDGREPMVLLLGLDAAGKTTLLYKSKLDSAIFANAPPRGINIEMMTPRRGARFQVYDLPGSKLTRYIWHNWFKSTEAIVYVVDSIDSVRIDEAKFELHDLLQSRDLRRVPLIVVANKQDADGAMNMDVVSAELELSTIRDRDWSIHETCAEKGIGIMKVFRDVVDKIKAFRHYKSGLRMNTKNRLKVSVKSKRVDGEMDLKFTNIELPDAKDNKKIPSLFDSVNKQTEIEGIHAEIASAENISDTSDSNPPEYDRPLSITEDDGGDDWPLNITEDDGGEIKSPAGYSDAGNIADLVVDAPIEKVKVTDLDVYSSDTDTCNDNDAENFTCNEVGSLYEFEANAPVAVV